jgi:tetratricopeptide (TPR) repeat protein
MAQELAPDHPEVVSYISTMIKKSGDFYKEAMSKLQTLNLNSNSNSEEELSEAVRLLTQALALVPDDMRLLILRAKAYRAQKNFEKSLTDIDDAAFNYCKSMLGDEVPKFVPNRRIWLQTQAMKGKYREPIIVTQQRSLTLNELAMIEVRNQNYSKAIMLLNRVIEEEFQLHGKDMTKVNAKFFVNRGDCYRATGKIEQAMSDFHRAYDSDPNNWETKTRLSMIHYMAGLQLFNDSMYNPAEIEFSIAIKYNPKVSKYYESRGKSCFYQYNYDGAYTDYKKALQLDPGNRDVLMRMQQFDPSGTEVAAITSDGGSSGKQPTRGSNGAVIGDLGMDLAKSASQQNIQIVRTSRTAPAPTTNEPFLPSLTSLTRVNPHMKKAAIVKDFVTSKRERMSRTLSVNARRRQHPIKKGNHWTVMEPKKVVYKSMTDRKALLEKEKKTKKKKNVFHKKKEVRLGASSTAIF